MGKELINIKMAMYLKENLQKERNNLEFMNILKVENMKDILKTNYLTEKEF